MQPKQYSWSDVTVIASAQTSAYPDPPNPATSAATLCYADIMTRGFGVIANYARLQDREALVMCGLVGYVLHNMPRVFAARLQGETGIFYLDGRGVSTWRAAVPDFYLSVFDSVFMPAPPVSESAADAFNVPPADKQQQYIKRLYQVFQAARHGLWPMLRKTANGDPQPRNFLEPIEVENARYCALLAETFQPIPHALLHWTAFVEPHFEQEANRRKQQLASEFVPYWNRVFAEQD